MLGGSPDAPFPLKELLRFLTKNVGSCFALAIYIVELMFYDFKKENKEFLVKVLDIYSK